MSAFDLFMVVIVSLAWGLMLGDIFLNGRQSAIARVWFDLKRLLDWMVYSKKKPDHRCECGVVWSKHSDRMKARHVDLGKPKAEFGKIHYYYGGHEITKAVEDIWSPIENVIEAVEKQCDYEKSAGDRYMEHRHTDLYPGHPWMQFVRTGHAAFIGWPQDFNDIGSEDPQERKRLSYAEQEKRLSESDRDLLSGQILTSTNEAGHVMPVVMGADVDVVPPIVRYDLNGLPIFDKPPPPPIPVTYKRGGEVKITRHKVAVLGGPAAGRQVEVACIGEPGPMEIDGVEYKPINDPDTGEFLGGYIHPVSEMCDCSGCREAVRP